MKRAWQWPDAWDMAESLFLMLDTPPMPMPTPVLAEAAVVGERRDATTAAVALLASAATWTSWSWSVCTERKLMDGDRISRSTWDRAKTLLRALLRKHMNRDRSVNHRSCTHYFYRYDLNTALPVFDLSGIVKYGMPFLPKSLSHPGLTRPGSSSNSNGP